jgi:hypothetical protein
MSLAFAMVFRLHGVHLGIRIFQPGFYIAVTVMIELTYPQEKASFQGLPEDKFQA